MLIARAVTTSPHRSLSLSPSADIPRASPPIPLRCPRCIMTFHATSLRLRSTYATSTSVLLASLFLVPLCRTPTRPHSPGVCLSVWYPRSAHRTSSSLLVLGSLSPPPSRHSPSYSTPLPDGAPFIIVVTCTHILSLPSTHLLFRFRFRALLCPPLPS